MAIRCRSQAGVDGGCQSIGLRGRLAGVRTGIRAGGGCTTPDENVLHDRYVCPGRLVIFVIIGDLVVTCCDEALRDAATRRSRVISIRSVYWQDDDPPPRSCSRNILK